MQFTIAQMVAKFLELKGTTFIQIWQVTQTISRARKTGNRFFGLVEKVNCLNAVTNYTYENMVNKARSKEAMAELRQAMINAGVPIDKIEAFFSGAKSDITENAETFKSSGLPYGNYVDDSKCIIDHTPESGAWADKYGFYIQCAILNYAEPVYRWIDSKIELTADELAEMKTFITPVKPNTKQGLAKPYVIRSPRFETIQSLTYKGTNYRLNG